MTALTPLIFRPSFAQRAVAILLFAGSWLVGVRGLMHLIQNMPRLLAMVRMAEINGEPTWQLWIALISSVAACGAGGVLLVLSVLFLLLIEGTHVLVDEVGLTVELGSLPAPIARRLGAGRLTWKQVASLEKGRFFFILRGGGNKGQEESLPSKLPRSTSTLRFLVVDQLDRLILTILERSPNLRFDS
ncbi:MAG: hypothetical protein Q8O00_02245 [Holophaga sp.]|nr:hypothetical protein [Holophaga sp.]